MSGGLPGIEDDTLPDGSLLRKARPWPRQFRYPTNLKLAPNGGCGLERDYYFVVYIVPAVAPLERCIFKQVLGTCTALGNRKCRQPLVFSVARSQLNRCRSPTGSESTINLTAMWIVRLALRRPYTFLVMAILIAIMGGLSIVTTPTDIFPYINIPMVGVIWNYSGMSPDDMSRRVLFVSERAMTTTVDNIERIESTA